MTNEKSLNLREINLTPLEIHNLYGLLFEIFNMTHHDLGSICARLNGWLHFQNEFDSPDDDYKLKEIASDLRGIIEILFPYYGEANIESAFVTRPQTIADSLSEINKNLDISVSESTQKVLK